MAKPSLARIFKPERRYGVVFAIFGCGMLLMLLLVWYHFVYVETPEACEWKNSADALQPFPKIVHRIWFQAHEVPEKYQRNWEHCKEVNPGWEFKLWSHEDIEEWLQREYPWNLPVYYAYKYFVLKTDLARYSMVYHFGGIYVDLDLDCNIPFETMIKDATGGVDYGVILGAGRPIGIGNSFICGKARHPFFWMMMQNLKYHQGSYLFPYWTVMLAGGTLYVAKMYFKYPCSEQIKIIPAHWHNELYLTHQHASSWHQTDGLIFIWFGAHMWVVYLLVFLFFGAVIYCARRCQKLAFGAGNRLPN